MPRSVEDLKVRIFADGADRQGILQHYAKPWIKGFTTNPTLMRKAGISDYAAFAKEILVDIDDRPISFEVFSDEIDDMYRQGKMIAEWAENVYVKIPVTNTKGESTVPLVSRLAAEGVKVNVTALFTLDQVEAISEALGDKTPSNISIFAGRIADTGEDPIPTMRRAVEIMSSRPNQELIWASPRELLNVVQAHDIGCHIITATSDILAKLALMGKDLHEYSLETVKMFYSDASAAGYKL